MQHIEIQNLIPAWVGVLGWIGTGVFLLASLYFIIRHTRRHSERDSVISYSLMIPLAACFLIALMSTTANRPEQIEAFRQAVSERYGVELSDEELVELDYPREEPSTDFEAFGSFSETNRIGDKIISNTTHLIWENGELFLADSSGEELAELETAR